MRLFFKNLFGKRVKTRTHLESLASLISADHPDVMRHVQCFITSPNAYFDALDEDFKEDCFIDSPSDVTNTGVLVRALYESGFLAVADNREEPLSALEKLNKCSKGVLENSHHYESLKKFYEQTKWGFGSLVGGGGSIEHSPDIFTCANAVQLAVLAINDDSDALIMFICSLDKKDEISSLAEQAGVRLYFDNM